MRRFKPQGLKSGQSEVIFKKSGIPDSEYIYTSKPARQQVLVDPRGASVSGVHLGGGGLRIIWAEESGPPLLSVFSVRALGPVGRFRVDQIPGCAREKRQMMGPPNVGIRFQEIVTSSVQGSSIAYTWLGVLNGLDATAKKLGLRDCSLAPQKVPLDLGGMGVRFSHSISYIYI